MPSLHIIVRRFVKFQHFIQLFGGAAVIVLCCSCEEIPSYVQNLRAGAFPWQATGSGYWKGDNGPGSPKIIVYLSEQRAYFYRGKRVIGESTVSTGKPGFSTPPGRYHVISKDRNHVSSEFGDYVDHHGNVVESNVDAGKDPQPPGTHFDGAHECPIACISTVATQCTRAMSRGMLRRMVASACRREWPSTFSTPVPKARP